MTVPLTRLALLAAALATCAGGASAQTQQSQPPQREDNQWGGLSHQPTEGQVTQNEKAMGIAPSPQEKAVNQDVEQMYQRLMGGAPAAAPPRR